MMSLLSANKKWKVYFFVVIFSLFFSTAALANLGMHIGVIAQTANKKQLSDHESKMFYDFDAPYLSHGYSVFIGYKQYKQPGLYTDAYGWLKAIADEQTSVPSGTGTFTSFSNVADFSGLPSDAVVNILNNHIAFIASGRDWQTGVYLLSDGSLSMVANQNTPMPQGNDNFASFAYPVNMSDGGVAFVGEDQGSGEGIYRANPKGFLSLLLDVKTSIPDGTGTFSQLGKPVFTRDVKNPTDFSFIGSGSDNQMGIYSYHKGKLTKRVDTNTSLPGNGIGYFTRFKDLSYDYKRGQMAFVGYGILGQESIYILNSDGLQKAVGLDDLVPNGIGRFQHFSHIVADDGNVLFYGKASQDQTGVYLFSQGQIFKVLNNHDQINKKQVQSIEITGQAMSSNQVDVLVTFADGTKGIFIITLTGQIDADNIQPSPVNSFSQMGSSMYSLNMQKNTGMPRNAREPSSGIVNV